MTIVSMQANLQARGLDPGPLDGVLGRQTYSALLAFLGPRSAPSARDQMARALAAAFAARDISNRRRIIHFLGQAAHECQGFTRFEENLNYSAGRLCQVWPRRFPSVAAAQPYANNPRALANKTYGGRLGNTGADDGWLFRGRGIFQLTGKENYRHFGQAIGVDLPVDPDKAADPAVAVAIACAFWAEKGLNGFADRDDIVEITRRIQGASEGLAERRANVARLKDVWPS